MMVNRSLIDGVWGRRMRVALLVLPVLLGCGSDTPAGQRGSPVLLEAFWRTGAARTLIWSASPGAMVTTAVVVPQPLELDLVFDRRLDGDRIEDTVVVGGVTTTQPKEDPPITVTWPGKSDVVAEHPFSLAVSYNSLPLSGQARGTTYVFGRATPGYPSGTMVTFHLDRAALTSVFGEPMVGPETLSVTTAPFVVVVQRPGTPDGGAVALVATDFQFPLAFSNAPGALAAVKPFVGLLINDAEATFQLVPDARNPTLIYVAPPKLGERWPAGARCVVAVKPGLPDLFGVVLAAGAEATFLTLGGNSDAAADAGAGADADPDADDADGTASDDTAGSFDGGADQAISDQPSDQ